MKKHYKFNVIENIQRQFTTSGQDARSLIALITAGTKGITAQEMSSWAFRLGAHVHRLRHIYGLNIETVLEPHESSWGKGKHARYILHSEVKIIGTAEID